MPLVKYSQYITYPDSSPAANRLQRVYLLGGNVDVPLFADKPATVPLTNPLMTDGDGLMEFYAAPGSFITELAGDIFHFLVDPAETDAAWPGTFVHTQAVAATVWTVEHHIGAPPSVEVLIGTQRVEATIDHPDDETTVITFSAPQTGTAFLRR